MINIDNEKAIMEFGTGDIGFNTYVRTDTDEKGIIFYNQEPRNIGDEGDFKANTFIDRNDFPVQMIFNKIESIDVVIKALEDLKRTIINEEQGIGFHFECDHCGDMTNVSERKVVFDDENICQECYNHLDFN